MKMTDIASYDQDSGDLTPLFDPRVDSWEDHIDIVDGVFVGKTSIGRVSIRLLIMNAPDQVNLRRVLIRLGQWK